MNDRIGCSTITFHTLIAAEALTHIADLGFKVVDIGVVPGFCPHFDPDRPKTGRDLVKLAEKLGLRVATLNTVQSLGKKDGMERLKARTRACLDLAGNLGAYGVTIDGSYPKAESSVWDAVVDEWAGFLQWAREEGSKLGIEVSVETPHQGSCCESLDESERLLSRLPRDFGITYDTSHVIAGGSDARESLERLGARVRHVHLRDAADKHIDLTPGDGEYDFKLMVRRLEDVGYRGEFILELEYGEALTDDQVGDEALKAAAFMDKVLG